MTDANTDPNTHTDPTEQDIDAAMNVLRRAHLAMIRGLAVDVLTSETASEHTCDERREAIDEYLHEVVDGCHAVIYTYAAKRALLCSDNEDACEDETGEAPKDPSVAACYAIKADVREMLDNEYTIADIRKSDPKHARVIAYSDDETCCDCDCELTPEQYRSTKPGLALCDDCADDAIAAIDASQDPALLSQVLTALDADCSLPQVDVQAARAVVLAHIYAEREAAQEKDGAQ